MNDGTDLQVSGWQGRAVVEDNAVLPPKQYTRAKLSTQREIARELAKLYRAARSGELDASLATKLTFILQNLSRILADGDLEARIEDLEAAQRSRR